jgi:hypothetical protein
MHCGCCILCRHLCGCSTFAAFSTHNQGPTLLHWIVTAQLLLSVNNQITSIDVRLTAKRLYAMVVWQLGHGDRAALKKDHVLRTLPCLALSCSRTAEVGGVAERMVGGLEDMLNSTPTSAAPSAAATIDQAAQN